MNDTSPEIEALLGVRYAAMSGSERALMALQMFETAQQVVLSSLAPGLSPVERQRELCRRFYGDALAQAAYPEATQTDPKHEDRQVDAPHLSPVIPDPRVERVIE